MRGEAAAEREEEEDEELGFEGQKSQGTIHKEPAAKFRGAKPSKQQKEGKVGI